MRWDSYWYHDLYAEWVAPTLFQGNLYMVTWTQLADTQITGAVSAVAAGQTLLDGWIDLVGGSGRPRLSGLTRRLRIT